VVLVVVVVKLILSVQIADEEVTIAKEKVAKCDNKVENTKQQVAKLEKTARGSQL
jgi:hypothetical protein